MPPVLKINWVTTAALAEVPSPAIILGLEPIASNLRKMIEIIGDPVRLRPHVKTHKLPWLVQQQLAAGITRFKCATIAEAEMCARAGAPDVFIAYQLVGPNVARLLELQRKYPATRFSCMVDELGAARALSAAATEAGKKIEVLLDLNVGQNRTGLTPGPEAVSFYKAMAALPGLIPGGLHAYDGHLQWPDLNERTKACAAGIAPVLAMRDELQAAGVSVPRVVAGGSPTFALHAARGDSECSPGTVVLWDASYATLLPDLEFTNAAVLLTRVISKPAPDKLCLDLGHKAVGSEMPHPRVLFPALPDAEGITHSEEHLVIKTAEAGRFAVGDALLAVPWHVCPSLALHAQAILVEGGRVTGAWPIEARARKITV